MSTYRNPLSQDGRGLLDPYKGVKEETGERWNWEWFFMYKDFFFGVPTVYTII